MGFNRANWRRPSHDNARAFAGQDNYDELRATEARKKKPQIMYRWLHARAFAAEPVVTGAKSSASV